MVPVILACSLRCSAFKRVALASLRALVAAAISTLIAVDQIIGSRSSISTSKSWTVLGTGAM